MARDEMKIIVQQLNHTNGEYVVEFCIEENNIKTN